VRHDVAMSEKQYRPWSGDFECLDCGTNTLETGEYYMLQDAVWLEANPSDRGMLCIGCVEKRLGRTLAAGAFSQCPLNDCTVGRSERVRNRIASA
jgi:hypothetical protein